MKTLKSLFLLCAGLSFCACGSDNEPQLVEGNGAVTVKIAAPQTRAISDGTAAGTHVVDGDITVTVTHSNGQSTAVFKWNGTSYTIGETANHTPDTAIDAAGNSLEYTFFGIGTPSKISASMYGGVDSYNAVAITGGTPELQVAPSQIPVYGEDKTFDKGDNIIDGTTTYQQYLAEVKMTIPVARLEVNVKVGDMSTFKSVKLLGAYLDKIKPDGNTAAKNYYLQGDQSDTKKADKVDGNDLYAVLKDSYISSPISMAEDDFLPAYDGEKKQYFAYNFYAAEANPEFKLLLQVEPQDGQAVIPTYQYAILKNFNVTFANENIYTANVVLNDENIQIDEEGADIQYALTATVTKASWTAVGVTGSWGQGGTTQQ